MVFVSNLTLPAFVLFFSFDFRFVFFLSTFSFCFFSLLFSGLRFMFTGWCEVRDSVTLGLA